MTLEYAIKLCHEIANNKDKDICEECKQDHLQLAKWLEEVKKYKVLKQLVSIGDVFSPQQFFNDYESCLKSNGCAAFITKDLEIIEDFKKGWELLQKASDKYNIILTTKCKIAFVLWFNR